MGNSSSSHGKGNRKCRSLPNSPDVRRQIPVAYSKTNGGTAIPLPATVLVQRRCPPDKVRPLPPTPNHTPIIPGLTKSGDLNGTGNHRPESPQSNITLTSATTTTSSSQKTNNNGLRQPNQCKIPTSPYGQQQTQQTNTTAKQNGGGSIPTTKHSMFNKLFNKDKSSSNNSSSSTSSATSNKSQVSKRTSSSSGFSSARSERSDSSLSLNEGQQQSQMKQPAVTANKKDVKNAGNTKQSKLSFMTSQKSSTSTLKKSKDKEKSPARQTKENDAVDSKIASLKRSSTAQKSKASTTSSKNINSKLETRSDSRQSLSKLSTTSTIASSNGTGIPKPMAAVKGTAKPSNNNNNIVEKKQSTDTLSLKSEKSNISSKNEYISERQPPQQVQQPQQLQLQPNQHIVKPTPNGPIDNRHTMNDSLPTSDSSGVVYRSQELQQQQQQTQYTPRMMVPSFNEAILAQRCQTMEKSGNICKFNTVPNKVSTIYEEEQQQHQQLLQQQQQHHQQQLQQSNHVEQKMQVNIHPMRPLLRGYNSHLTLPSRGARGTHQHPPPVGNFSEADIGQGYCSDGDIFKSPFHGVAGTLPTRIGDIDNGYLSEGGGGSSGHHAKHFLNMMRNRTQLPTTFEERIRGSGGSLDSTETAPPSVSSGESKMDDKSRGLQQNGRDNWTKMPEPALNGTQQQRKEKSSSSPRRSQSSNKQSSTSSRTKGVPQSFGYVKRTNDSSTGTITTTEHQQQVMTGRTAHVSAVPRAGKMKSSIPNEMQQKPMASTQHRSFSLTGPSSIQLSQSIRDRLASGSHSLPKPGTDLHLFQHRISSRNKLLDGSLSDTQTYAEVKPEYSSYALWLKHSNTAGSRLSEGDSLENVQIGSPGLNRHGHGHKMMHRGNSAGGVSGVPNESIYTQSPRLNRSNSIRSTKSEKMYPSMLSRAPDMDIEPYYCLPVGTMMQGVNGAPQQTVPWSQPTSPIPPNRAGFTGPLSPTHCIPSNPNACHRLTYPKKNDDVHGSAASLLSGGSSLYSSAEERQAGEIRRLKRELLDARDTVMSLSSQLSTNAQVVTAFEQSLGNMTQRLQHLTATAERKDGELTDMRQTIELLKKQSIQAGLTSAHMQSMGVQSPQQNNNNNQIKTPSHIVKSQPILNGSSNIATIQTVPSTITTATTLQRHHSTDSMCSINSIGSNCSTQDKNKKKKGWLRSSFTKAFSRNAKIAKTSRHHLNHNHHHSFAGNGDSSSKCETPPLQSTPIKSHLDSKLPKLPQPLGSGSPSKLGGIPQKTVTVIDNAKPIDAIDEANPVVEDLKRQLREKDLVLTDTRLEALNSASQLENMKEQMNKMRAQMKCLKEDNLRLHKFYSSRSLAGSEVSLGNPVSPNGSIGDNRRYSLADGNSRPPMELPTSLEEDVEEENIPPAPAPEPPPQSMSPTTHIDLTPPPPALETIQLPSIRSPNVQHHTTAVEDIPDITDGKKISISVYLGQPEAFQKYYEEVLESDRIYGDDDIKSYSNEANNEFIIAFTYISGKTTWQNLDYIVRKTFKDYLAKIDPGTNLGLNTDSITSYHLGDAKRGPEVGFPELLPCGYIIGNVRSLYICLQGVGSLAFDSLIPRSIVHRYISLLGEHRRLILCGPSGTGKSYLARRLAEFLVAKSGRENISEAIATFNVDHKSSKDLQEYLGHIAEQSSMANGASDLPSVIILDNLHHASALGDVFSCLLSAGPASKLPCIIGTMSQATCNTTNLQLHHNFRWVLTANHMEPVKGFLSRFLRRRLFTIDLTALHAQPELQKVLAWLPTVWQHINRFLENHSSSDVTIGPRLFLSCPMDLKDSQVWFTDIWNYHLAPYIIEAVREGVQLYGRRGGAWNDPSTFIRDTYPWPYGPDSVPPLRQINAEEVGLEGSVNQNSDQPDPLMNMLMRLQEAANYSENQEQESDCASLDSNITPDSSAGAE
ncbi:NAV2 family protein [Megaselia abdita]